MSRSSNSKSAIESIIHSETAEKTYDRLKNDRQQYIDRAVDCAKYTIPSIFPKEGSDGGTKFDTPYQSVGARCVNNLANKLMLALFPPNSPFFRLSLSDKAQIDFKQAQEKQAEIEETLGQFERTALNYMENKHLRVTLAEAMKHCVVVGNCLLFLPPTDEGGIKMYKLDHYTVQRDALGNVVQLITLDEIAFISLPEDLQKVVIANSDSEVKPDEVVKVYTHVYKGEDDNFYSYQEIKGVLVQGSESNYPCDSSPWIPVRMCKVDGEHYGRSLVEEYLGDFKTLENLSKALTDLAALSSFISFLVNPNGQTRVSKLKNSKSGEFIPGRIEDINVLQIQKYNDMQVTKATIDDITMRLSYAFMLNSAVQRQGERVTAEEIRYVARELEDTLGGIYSILSQELQLPLVKRVLAQLQAVDKIPDLPADTIDLAITTGLEALGRGQDLNKLSMFLEYAMQIPDVAQRINTENLLKRIATSLSLDTTGLVKTEEELQQEMQQAQMQQMLQQATPAMAQGMVDANMPAEGQE